MVPSPAVQGEGALMTLKKGISRSRAMVSLGCLLFVVGGFAILMGVVFGTEMPLGQDARTVEEAADAIGANILVASLIGMGGVAALGLGLLSTVIG